MTFYKTLLVGIPVVAFGTFIMPDQPDTPPAQFMAAALAPVLPKNLGDGANILSAKAQGDLLVVVIDVPFGIHWTNDEMSKMVAGGFCQTRGAARYIEDGGKVRFDVSNGGGTPATGPVVDRCPGIS